MIVALRARLEFQGKDHVSYRLDIHRVSLTMVIIIAMITVALPLCQMFVCDMPAGMMSHHGGLTLGSDCDLGTLSSTSTSGIVPPGAQSIFFLLAALLGVAITMLFPTRQVSLVRVVAEEPPAPPEDPRGERLII